MEFKYYSVKEILNFLEMNHLSVNKKFGQNFLINAGVCDTIVKSLDITENDVVFEIGCGLGSLTNRLIESGCRKLVGFEIDKAYITHLNNLFGADPKFTLVEGDFLKTFESAVKEHTKPGDSILITGNLPYYITTPILEKIFESDIQAGRISFMMQKEVAERIISSEGTKKYGSLTIFAHFYSIPQIVCRITPSSFYPPPNVDSAVVRFTVVKDKYQVASRELFFKVSRSLFINRRKQLKNNLMNSPFLKGLTAEDVVMLLEKAGIQPEARGETLSMERICTLTNVLGEFLKNR